MQKVFAAGLVIGFTNRYEQPINNIVHRFGYRTLMPRIFDWWLEEWGKGDGIG